MKKSRKIFIAVDTNSTSRAKKIIRYTKTKKLKIGYKFGLEFLNSKNGRSFVSRLNKKIMFTDIAKIIESVMSDVTQNDADSIEKILKDDELARKHAIEIIRDTNT